MSKDNVLISDLKPKNFMEKEFGENLRNLKIKDLRRVRLEKEDVFDFLEIDRLDLTGGKNERKN